MICKDCQAQDHEMCREQGRQLDETLTVTDKAGGQWCDCQHVRNWETTRKVITPVIRLAGDF